MSAKRTVLGLVMVLAAVVAVWFAYSAFQSTAIAGLLANPREYEGKLVTIQGQVVERQSLLVVKYFVVADKTAQITVVTNRSLPDIGKSERVRGKIKEAFSIGSARMIVLMEEPAVR